MRLIYLKIIAFIISLMLFCFSVVHHCFVIIEGSNTCLEEFPFGLFIFILLLILYVYFINEGERRKALGIKSELFWVLRDGVIWLNILAVLLFAYGVVNFLVRVSGFDGVASNDNGVYSIKVHGVIREHISENYYYEYKEKKHQGESISFSAFLMFVFMIFMSLFFPKGVSHKDN